MILHQHLFVKRSVGLLLVLLLVGCGKEPAAQPDIPVVRAQRISLGSAAGGATYAGEVRGRYESQLAFQVGGKVAARFVELGSTVKAGDVLFRLDPKDVAENVRIGAAQVASAEAQLALAEANKDRYHRLYEQQAVSAAQYDQYRTSYDAALATYKQAVAQYAQSDNALGYTSLTAGGDGVIAAVSAEAGQVVAAGQTVATLVRTDALEVEIHIPENRLADLPPDRALEVSFWALDGVRAVGRVREVSPIADPVARTYKARIRLPEPPPGMRLGMTASVKSADGVTTGEAVVPLAALYQTGEQPQVWLVVDGAVRRQAVTVEAFGDNQVRVSAGLRDGDVIVTAGVHKLREGQQVRLEGEAP